MLYWFFLLGYAVAVLPWLVPIAVVVEIVWYGDTDCRHWLFDYRDWPIENWLRKCLL